MFDPAALTLGQVSSALRDFTIIGVLVSVAWKSRGWYEMGKNFFERWMNHMDTMEEGMHTLLTNHLTHIESDLRNMSQRQVRATDFEQAQYIIEDETGK